MTKITTDFNGSENATVRASRRKEIHDFWFGAGEAEAEGTFAGVRANINGIYDPDTANGEAFGSWLTKWNALNEPDKLLNDTLKDSNPALFVLADDTARVFGPDGVTPVSAPGTAVSLIGDDWEGLELGSELVTNGTFDTDLTGWTTPGWSVQSGAAEGVGGGAALQGGFTAQVAKVYLVRFDILQTPFVNVSVAGVSFGSYTTPQSVFRVVRATSALGFSFAAGGGINTRIDNVSAREVLNWPAYQNTARPAWGRAPAQVRNLLTNSDLAGAVAGTPGTAPWAELHTTGSITAVAADGLLGGNSVTFAATAQRRVTGLTINVYASTVYHFTSLVEVLSGSVRVDHLIDFTTIPAGASVTWAIDGAPVAGSIAPAVGMRTLTAILTVGATGGTAIARIGVGLLGNATGSVRFWAPRVTLAADAALPYQRRGPVAPDITESGVRSFGLISMDGSDDALLHQLAAGGTVAVALFGRGGSYLIPSITLAAPSVLQLGPLSVLDDGVLVSGCPTGILRAVGTVPWSSRFELVGYAIMKANPSAEEKARAMRYFAAFGARGWLVEGANIVAADLTTQFTGATGIVVNATDITSTAASGVQAQWVGGVSAGVSYDTSFEVFDYSSGNIGFRIGDGGLTDLTVAANGTFRNVFVSDGTALAFRALTSGTWKIRNISVRALTPEF